MAQKNNLAIKQEKRLDVVLHKIEACESKIQILTEYFDIKRADLEAKLALLLQRNETKLLQSEKEIEYFTLEPNVVFDNYLSAEKAKKQAELRLLYREKRENIKRAKAVENADAVALDKELSDFSAQNDKVLEEFVATLDKDRSAFIDSFNSKAQAKDYPALLKELKSNNEHARSQFAQSEQARLEKNWERFNEKNNSRIKKAQEKSSKYHTELDNLVKSLGKEEYALPDDTILKVDDLCMYFGGLKAVDHLTFNVKKNEIFGLIGPNGAGKTTVFNCITQFYKCTAGNIYFKTKAGKVVNLNDDIVHNVILQGISRTFQNVEVIREVSVMENLLIAATRQYHATLVEQMFHTPMLKLEEEVIRKRAIKVLTFMGLLPYKDMLAWGLPYGILKKIEIARTLMCNPQLIILDEPAAGLNDTETADLSKLIKRIQSEFNCTILLVEHDMGLVMDICDHICTISFGKLLAYGTPKEIQSNKLVQEAYLGLSD